MHSFCKVWFAKRRGHSRPCSWQDVQRHCWSPKCFFPPSQTLMTHIISRQDCSCWLSPLTLTYWVWFSPIGFGSHLLGLVLTYWVFSPCVCRLGVAARAGHYTRLSIDGVTRQPDCFLLGSGNASAVALDSQLFLRPINLTLRRHRTDILTYI